MHQLFLAAVIIFSMVTVAAIGTVMPIRNRRLIRMMMPAPSCPGMVSMLCTCKGNCGMSALTTSQCLCLVCTPAPATAAHPPNPVPTPGCRCGLCAHAAVAAAAMASPQPMYAAKCVCGWTYTGTTPPNSCTRCGSAISFGHGPGSYNTVSSGGGSGGGSGGAGGSSAGSAGGGGGGGGYASGGVNVGGSAGGSGGWSHNTGGVPPGRSAGGSAGNSIMRRVTPRPPGRGAAAGMPGFTEQGELAPDFDLAIGSVRGLRQWNLQPPNLNADPARDSYLWQPPCMKGATGQFLWQPGVNEASCNSNRDHQPPVDFDEHGMSCGCGFWAYWTIQDLAVGGAMSINPNTGLPITGLIEGTGRVLIGEKGFRSQRAKIIAIAPAFSVQAYSPPDYGDRWGRSLPRSQVITDPLTDPAEAHRRAEALERENREAQQRADAWMAVIQDRLGLMYPDAEVYATLKGMLASVVTGEIT